jgi:hypothetical protein
MRTEQLETRVSVCEFTDWCRSLNITPEKCKDLGNNGNHTNCAIHKEYTEKEQRRGIYE